MDLETVLKEIVAQRTEFFQSGDAQQRERALQLASQAHEYAPNDPRTNYELGWSYRVLGKFLDALPLFEQAAYLDSRNANYQMEYARIQFVASRQVDDHMIQEEWRRGAERALKEAIKLEPNEGRFYHLLGQLYEEEFRTLWAIDNYEIAQRTLASIPETQLTQMQRFYRDDAPQAIERCRSRLPYIWVPTGDGGVHSCGIMV
ncbi:TPA: hypothetical protein HA242_05360 [Candidatus Woesearchaeota archaeon]|nr:hypothetical protein [Candidatus Woesearchaeota archaeon]